MDTVQLNVFFVGPGESGYYAVPRNGRNQQMGVGAHATLRVNGAAVVEGELSPGTLDRLFDAIEQVMDEERTPHFRSDGHPFDPTREGWAMRLLEGCVRRLREKVQKDLERSVDRLAARKAELGRIK